MPIKLTPHQLRLLRECCTHCISDQSDRQGRRSYYRLGGSGYVQCRYNAKTLPKLLELGLVEYIGYYRSTRAGEKLIEGLTGATA